MRAKVRHLLDAYTQQNVAVSKAEFDCIEVFLNKGFSDEASQKWLRHTRAALGPRLIQDSDAPFHLDFIFKDGAISETRVARQRAAWTQHCEENADRLRCAKEILDDLVNLSAGNYDGIRDSQGFVANVLRSRPFTMALLRDLKGKLAAGLYQGAGLNLGLLVPMSLPGALAVLANAGLGGLGFAMTFDPGLQSALVPQIAAGHFPTAANPNGGLSLNVLGAAAGPASAFLMGVVDPAANGIPPAMGAVANLHHAGYDDNDPQFVPAQRDILAHVQQSFPSATREKWGENVVHPSLAVAGFLSGIGGEKHRSRHTQTLREPSDLGLMPSEERAVWNAAIHNAKGSKVAHFLRGFAPRTLRNQLKAGSKGSKRYSDLIASRERYGVAGVVAAEALRRQAAREDHKAGAPQRDQARSDPNYWMHLTRPGSTHGTSRSTALRA